MPWSAGLRAGATPCWPMWPQHYHHQAGYHDYQNDNQSDYHGDGGYHKDGDFSGYHGNAGYGAQRNSRRPFKRRRGSPSAHRWQDWQEDWGEDKGSKGEHYEANHNAPWQRRNDRYERASGSSSARSYGGKGRGRPSSAAFQDEPEEVQEPIDPMLEMQMEIIEVPKKYIAKIIGKKGAQIRQIRDETGAHVDARDQSADPCQVKVLGTSDSIEAARKKIAEIIEASAHKPGIVLEIPRAKIGKVIGIRGAQIHEIQTITGAKVDVDKDVDPCKVTIGGDELQIAHAERVILTLAMEAADQESEYLDLPAAVSGAVLGVKGARLMELQAASGARIDVDKTRPAMCRVRIAGSPDQIEVAKQLVLLATEAPRPPEATVAPPLEGTENDESGVGPSATVVVDLPHGMSGKIIGRNGSTIQSIQGESGARVWVDCEASHARISGQPGAVEHAKLLVQALVDEELQQLQQQTASLDPSEPFVPSQESLAGGIAPTASSTSSPCVVLPRYNAGQGVIPRVVPPPPNRQAAMAAVAAANAVSAARAGTSWEHGQSTHAEGSWVDPGFDPWSADVIDRGGTDPTFGGSTNLQDTAYHDSTWEYSGQLPEDVGGNQYEGGDTKVEPDRPPDMGTSQEEDLEFSSAVRPKTAMQRAFAMLAAKRAGRPEDAAACGASSGSGWP